AAPTQVEVPQALDQVVHGHLIGTGVAVLREHVAVGLVLHERPITVRELCFAVRGADSPVAEGVRVLASEELRAGVPVEPHRRDGRLQVMPVREDLLRRIGFDVAAHLVPQAAGRLERREAQRSSDLRPGHAAAPLRAARLEQRRRPVPADVEDALTLDERVPVSVTEVPEELVPLSVTRTIAGGAGARPLRPPIRARPQGLGEIRAPRWHHRRQLIHELQLDHDATAAWHSASARAHPAHRSPSGVHVRQTSQCGPVGSGNAGSAGDHTIAITPPPSRTERSPTWASPNRQSPNADHPGPARTRATNPSSAAPPRPATP
ncbi:hypothetical protein GWI33_006494, partial [Rhynchophorus ferrugineus]